VPSSEPPDDGRYLTAYEVRPGLVRGFWRRGDTLHWRDTPVSPCIFVKRSDLDARPGVERSLRNSRHISSVVPEGDYVRVKFRDSHTCRQAAQKETGKGPGFFWGQGIPPLEADVSAVRRWSVDEGVKVQRPRRCYTDIETDSRLHMSQKKDMRLLCWAVVDDEGRRFGRVLEEDEHGSEKKLLEEWFDVVSGYDQILAWNGRRFDFEVLASRFQQRGVRVEWGRFLLLDQLELYKRMIASQGSETGAGKQSLALEAVAHHLAGKEREKLAKASPEERKKIEKSIRVLGAGKQKGESGESLGAKTWELWRENPAKLLSYCMDDTLLLAEIERVTGHCDLFQALAETCGVFPDSWGLYPTQFVESFLMRLGAERGLRFPTLYRDPNASKKKREKFKGAFVQAPTTKGVIENVHVCDFASLYPSIILTWNMSPETFRPEITLKEDTLLRPSYLAHTPIKERPLPPGHCVAARTDAVFANEPRGILCVALEEGKRLRKQWSELKADTAPGTPEHEHADRMATSIKVFNNSFYGTISSPWSRFFDKRIGESITQIGAWLNQEGVMAEARKRGYEVVYGDTDAALVTGCTREEMAEFVRWVNEVKIPEMVKGKGCSRSFVELDHEKGYRLLVMQSKKFYIGSWAYFKKKDATEDSKPEIKGLAFKRGDSIALARNLQLRVVNAILGYKRERCVKPDVFHRMARGHRIGARTEAFSLDEVTQSKTLSKRVTQRTTEKVRKNQPKLHAAIGEWVELREQKHKGALRGKRPDPTGAIRSEGYLEKVDREFVHVRTVGGELEVMPLGTHEIWVYQAEDPHVRVARLLNYRGKDTNKGVKIAYYFGPGGEPKPADDFAGDFDRAYLWEHLVWPPTERLLAAAFPGEDWGQYKKLYDAAPKAEKTQQDLFAL
jgi:DNA polymerase elongation subunit (family B)